MKKMIAFLLLISLLLGLAGCSFGRRELTDEEALTEILGDLAKNLHPGTAGSSMTSLRLAFELIDWARKSEMDKKEAAALVMDWLREQSPELRAAFQEKITSIQDSYSRLIQENGSKLLDSIGINDDLSNLTARLKELVEAVLASGGVER